MSTRREGLCQLFKTKSLLVKRSHIIPQSFTRRTGPNFPFMEMDGVTKPSRQQSSWYDSNLVSMEAEELFAKWDGVGAQVLKGEGLTTRSANRRLPPAYKFITLGNVDLPSFKLFALSLLWRASATTLPAFDGIRLTPTEQEKLRVMLIEGNPGTPTDFPVLLLVLSNDQSGVPMAPLALEIEGIQFIRFYLDGVILYIGTHSSLTAAGDKFGKWLVGSADDLLLFAIPYENSTQEKTVSFAAEKTLEKWGNPWGRLGLDNG